MTIEAQWLRLKAELSGIFTQTKLPTHGWNMIE